MAASERLKAIIAVQRDLAKLDGKDAQSRALDFVAKLAGSAGACDLTRAELRVALAVYDKVGTLSQDDALAVAEFVKGELAKGALEKPTLTNRQGPAPAEEERQPQHA